MKKITRTDLTKYFDGFSECSWDRIYETIEDLLWLQIKHQIYRRTQNQMFGLDQSIRNAIKLNEKGRFYGTN